MGGAVVFGLLCVVFVIAGCVFGWIAFFRTQRLQQEVHQLRTALVQMHNRAGAGGSNSTATQAGAQAGAQADAQAIPAPDEPRAKPAAEINPSVVENQREPDAQPRPAPSQASPAQAEPTWADALSANLRANWMTWLGGLSVALAGVFLVRYGIEAGLLGPAARVTAGVLTGLGLHAAAEWLRRRGGANHPALAALAGGGSITLYAAGLAALHLYALLPPLVVFAALAVVSVATMALALRHGSAGPVLAIMGILGGFAVPLAVGGDGGQIVSVLVYALILTAAALLLIQRVYRTWLWAGTLAGAFGWWLLALGTTDADAVRGLYLAALAYLLLALAPHTGIDLWLRAKLAVDRPQNLDPVAQRLARLGLIDRVAGKPLPIALLLVAAASGFSVAALPPSPNAIWPWLLTGLPPLLVLLFAAVRDRPALWCPWVAIAAQVAGWLVLATGHAAGDRSGAIARTAAAGWPFELAASSQQLFLIVALASVAVTVGFAVWRLPMIKPADDAAHRSQPQMAWASLGVLSPLVWLGLAVAVTSALFAQPTWAAVVALVGVAYLGTATRRLGENRTDALTVWLYLGGFAAWSLAAVIFLRAAPLTLALALQAVPLAWIIRRCDAPELGWLLKAVLGVVIVRLTFNAELADYLAAGGWPNWTLWTYGGAALAAFGAARQLGDRPRLRGWAEAAALHLLVLTLWTETRYWLRDAIFEPGYGLVEAGVNQLIWAGLALAYLLRARHSNSLNRLYRMAAAVLGLMALASYALALTALNPLLGETTVANTTLINALLLVYGVPVGMLILSRYVLRDDAVQIGPFSGRQVALAGAAAAAFVFLNLEIRHLWQGGAGMALAAGTGSGEQYTYSAVWLLLAAATLLLKRNAPQGVVYRAGLGLLGLATAKVFLLDMAGLDGLLRVASFMGLGLSLLGLAYLLRRGDQPAD